VFYEDLKENPIAEIRKVIKFIEKINGFKPENLEQRLLCLSENLKGDFARKHNQQFDPYTEKLKKIINLRIDQAQEVFKNHKINARVISYK